MSEEFRETKKRPIESVKEEREISTLSEKPPASKLVNELGVRIVSEDIKGLNPKEARDWRKWLKNLSFIKTILTFMMIIYVADIIVAIIAPGVYFTIQESFFEALRTLLFMVAGFVFAKSSDS